MKLLASLFAFILITSTSAYADFRKDLYESVQEEVQYYYSTSGQWSLVKVKHIQEVVTENNEFILMKAKVTIKNIDSNKLSKETCLVSFANDNFEFYGINCF